MTCEKGEHEFDFIRKGEFKFHSDVGNSWVEMPVKCLNCGIEAVEKYNYEGVFDNEKMEFIQ